MIPIHALPFDFEDAFNSIFGSSDLKKQLQKITGKKYVYFTANARSALYFAIQNLKLKPNDEVIVPAYGCDIVETVVKKVCKPVYVDVSKETYTIDVSKIKSVITKNTKAIIPVNLFGNPCDMSELMELAESKDLEVIENCAQSLMAKYKNRFSGSFGKSSVFSFRFSKDISCFFGGALAIDEEIEIDSRMSSFTNPLASFFLPLSSSLKFFPKVLYQKIFAENLSGKRFPEFEPNYSRLTE